MKIYFSKTQNAGDVSFSCQSSIKDWWNEDDIHNLMYEDERVSVFSDHSYDKWNGRLGCIVQSKESFTDENGEWAAIEFSMHFTGMGFGWGHFHDRMAGGKFGWLIAVPDFSETVRRAVEESPEWQEFRHPLFYGLGDGIRYANIPMVPNRVQ